MSADYKGVTKGKLILKGEKRSHKKHKSHKRPHVDDNRSSDCLDDKSKHGGWWRVSTVSEIAGSIAIQYGKTPAYILALNQGLFTIGPPHDEGDGPSPEEILTAVPASNGKVAFKSGYGKYLSVDKNGVVTGIADAIGLREEWEPVFQDGQTALLAPNSCFLSVDAEDTVIARNLKAEEDAMIVIRSNKERLTEKIISESDQGKLKDVELSYVKMFQKFQDKKIKINQAGRAELKDAKGMGKLHESLLDRRSKMKADRYCK